MFSFIVHTYIHTYAYICVCFAVVFISVHVIIRRLIHDRELSLFGGERLVSEDSYNLLKNKVNGEDEKMREL